MIGSTTLLMMPHKASPPPVQSDWDILIGVALLLTLVVVMTILFFMATRKMYRRMPKPRKLPTISTKASWLSRVHDALALLGVIAAIVIAYAWHAGFIQYLWR